MFWVHNFFKMINLFIIFASENGRQLLSHLNIFSSFMQKSPKDADEVEVDELCGSAPPHPVRCPVNNVLLQTIDYCPQLTYSVTLSHWADMAITCTWSLGQVWVRWYLTSDCSFFVSQVRFSSISGSIGLAMGTWLYVGATMAIQNTWLQPWLNQKLPDMLPMRTKGYDYK